MADSIPKIISDSVLKTEGVSGICFPGILRIHKDFNQYDIEVYLSIIYGFSIPETVWNVQKNISNCLKTYNINNISKINIHVENIVFKENK